MATFRALKVNRFSSRRARLPIVLTERRDFIADTSGSSAARHRAAAAHRACLAARDGHLRAAACFRRYGESLLEIAAALHRHRLRGLRYGYRLLGLQNAHAAIPGPRPWPWPEGMTIARRTELQRPRRAKLKPRHIVEKTDFRAHDESRSMGAGRRRHEHKRGAERRNGNNGMPQFHGGGILNGRSGAWEPEPRATQRSACKRSMAAMPKAGPSARPASSTGQPSAAATSGVNCTVTMVSAKPSAVWNVSSEPACSGGE